MSNKSTQGDAIKTSTEVAKLAADAKYIGFIHNYNLSGKFIIPVLVPLMKSNTIVEETTKIPSSKGANLSTSKIVRTNYVSIPIPMHLVWEYVIRSSIRRFSPNVWDTNLYVEIRVPKGTEFTINFVGDDINKIRVTGINKRY